MYYAIVGDMVNSKKITNRLKMQEKLKAYLEKINQEYKEIIAANFIITLGDEFQGLLKSPLYLFDILYKTQIAMKPLKIRFGIGIGDILTTIDNKMSIGSDGPAWWFARDMINDLKSNQKGLKRIANIKVAGEFDQDLLDLININLSICYSIMKNWTSEQREVVEYIISNYGLNDQFIQKDIAKEIGISPVNLNKKLKLSLYYDWVYTHKKIEKLLNKER